MLIHLTPVIYLQSEAGGVINLTHFVYFDVAGAAPVDEFRAHDMLLVT